jgi:colanic acid/amylovoran biosynthesis protein
MTVDIRGTDEQNKGALLMLEAVCERLGPRTKLSANPFAASWETRARLELRQTLHSFRRPRSFSVAGNFIPKRLTHRYGIVSDDEITGVVDASGFAYSDSFSVKRQQREVLFGRRWKANGVPKVLLPQAFGPFEDATKSIWSREIIEQAALVCVRDRRSLEHVKALAPGVNPILSPDFTIGLSADPSGVNLAGGVALVPNTKIITHGVMTIEAYVDFFVACGAAAAAAGVGAPVVVLHETGDVDLGKQIAERLDCAALEPGLPRGLKYSLGTASLVVASRYHAIVSGLSQGVPTVIVGWSHKYEELARDFGVPEWVWHGPDDGRADELIARVSASATDELFEAREALIEKNEMMWGAVTDVLGI